MKKATSYRLSEDALELIEQLKEKLGISQASVVEQAVRKLARLEGIADKSQKAQK